MTDPTNDAAAAEELVDYEEEEVAEAEAGKAGEVRHTTRQCVFSWMESSARWCPRTGLCGVTCGTLLSDRKRFNEYFI